VAHPGPYVRLSSLTCPAGQAEKSGVQQPIFLAVGPEGGFTADEIALSTAAGWQPIDLGPRILRIETAATVLVALVAESLRDSKPNLPIPE
jgi:RsmE family RNA methyltransferase